MTAYAQRKDIDLEWIVRNMVGENFDLGSPPTGHEIGEVALSIENLTVPAPPAPAISVVDRLSLDVRAGEIVCIYGLMGAGRTELMECVAGRLPRLRRQGSAPRQGRVAASASPSASPRPRARARGPPARRAGADDDRRPEPVARQHRRLHQAAVHLAAAERAIVDRSIRDVRIKTAGGGALIGSLSGGNQQKVVIGKMLATNPTVVLLDEPSRGIDIGAKAEVFRLLAEGARAASRSSTRPPRSASA